MSRAVWVSLAVCAIVLSAGCQAGPGGGPGTGTLDSDLSAESVKNSPDGVTVVNATNPQLATVTPIQNILEKAEQTDGGSSTRVNLDKSTHEQLLDVYANLPTYDNGEPTTVPESGPVSATIYVNYNGTVYRVRLSAGYPV